MTATDATNTQPDAPQRPMMCNGLCGIFRTGRVKSARSRKHSRDALIAPNHCYHQARQGDAAHKPASSSPIRLWRGCPYRVRRLGGILYTIGTIYTAYHTAYTTALRLFLFGQRSVQRDHIRKDTGIGVWLRGGFLLCLCGIFSYRVFRCGTCPLYHLSTAQQFADRVLQRDILRKLRGGTSDENGIKAFLPLATMRPTDFAQTPLYPIPVVCLSDFLRYGKTEPARFRVRSVWFVSSQIQHQQGHGPRFFAGVHGGEVPAAG
jgi:hypothetical protein